MTDAATIDAPPRRNVLVWAPQDGPQRALVHCPMPEVFFGGARGGGKTDGVLGKWAIKERRYGQNFNAIALRRSTVSFEDAIERSKEIYRPLGGKFNETEHKWRMPNGGRVAFAYLESIRDADEYQGRNVTDAWVEEAGQFADSGPIDRLFGVLRSAHGVPVQLILTANPGGAGQHWICARYGLAPFPTHPRVIRKKLPNGDEHLVAVIPSRITDNRIMLSADPGYVGRLHLVGSAQLVRAWLEGDWTAIEGAFFDCWSETQHVLTPFAVPSDWLRFRSADWGSASPFSIGWWAVVQDDYVLEDPGVGPRISPDRDYSPSGEGGRRADVLPRGAIIRYREWYGASSPGRGLKLTAEHVADGIVARELLDHKLAYGVLDPAAFAEDGGPSIAERINTKLQGRGLAAFTEADNKRVAQAAGSDRRGAMGGWDQMRGRLVGTAKRARDGSGIDWSTGRPMAYVFRTCRDSIRTIPVLQHDPKRAEDLDTTSEDHAADDWRYGCMSRPWVKFRPPAPDAAYGYGPRPNRDRGEYGGSDARDSFKTL